MATELELPDELEEWLAAPSGAEDDPVLTNPTRLEHFARIVYCNGGTQDSGYGITMTGGIYGMTGISHQHSMDLMQLSAFLVGVEMMCPGVGGIIRGRVKAIWDARLAEQEAEMKALEAANAG